MLNIHKEDFTQRQTMLEQYFEFHHYYDEIPPEVDFHQHPFYEIFFFFSGNVSYVIEGKIYKLRPGDILLTNNMDIHRPIIQPGAPYERVVIWLADNYFDQVRACGDDISACFRDAASKDYRLIRPDSRSLEYMKLLCRRIAEARRSRQLGSYTLSSAYMMEFLVQLSRSYFETPNSVIEDITENEKINRVLRHINENITGDLSLDGLSNAFYISKYYLSKQFKQFTGISIYQYIIKKRLTISSNMLRMGVPVTSAYIECGFNDYSNYLKAFKREFGQNPSDYSRRGCFQ